MQLLHPRIRPAYFLKTLVFKAFQDYNFSVELLLNIYVFVSIHYQNKKNPPNLSLKYLNSHSVRAQMILPGKNWTVSKLATDLMAGVVGAVVKGMRKSPAGALANPAGERKGN